MNARKTTLGSIWNVAWSWASSRFRASFMGQPRFWLIFGSLLIVTSAIGHTRPVAVASNAMWDAIESYGANVDEELAARVAVIEITDENYAQLFASTSPLAVEPLAQLIGLILHQNPQKLIVDLDTSDVRFVALPARIADVLQCLRAPAPQCAHDAAAPDLFANTVRKIVWARGAVPPLKDATAFALQPVLGHDDSDGQTIWSAAVMVRPDDDGRVRRIMPFLPIASNAAFVSMPVAARPGIGAMAAINGAAKWRTTGEDIRLRFLPSLRRLPIAKAGDFLSRPANLEGKTVFLGGSYAANDAFTMTDGGEYPGVEVMAASALALTARHTVTDFGLFRELAVDVVLGLIVAGIHHRWRRWALPLNVAVTVGALLVASFLGYAIGFVLNLARFLIGVSIHQMVSDAEPEAGPSHGSQSETARPENPDAPVEHSTGSVK